MTVAHVQTTTASMELRTDQTHEQGDQDNNLNEVRSYTKER